MFFPLQHTILKEYTMVYTLIIKKINYLKTKEVEEKGAQSSL